MGMAKRMISLKLGILLVAITLLSLTFTAANALTQYSFVKPYTAKLVFTDTPFKIETSTLAFEPNTNRYANATVSVKNYGTADATATIYVRLYESATVIAWGQASVPTTAVGSTYTTTIPLTWTTGKDMTNVSSGNVIVQ